MDIFNSEQTINLQLIGGNMDEQDEVYKDPRFEMFSEEEQFKTVLKVYGVAFAVVVFGIMPWAIGACMMIKWAWRIIF